MPTWSFLVFPGLYRLSLRPRFDKVDAVLYGGGGGGMMAAMLTQVPLPWLPGDAAEVAPGVGLTAGPDGGGVVWVHGLATFTWVICPELSGQRICG